MVDMEKIVSLSKRRGFIFQSSEIYGGLGSAWDYGPLGVELKNNVKRLWWRDNVHLRDDMVGLDAAITMHPRVWEASGHLASFSDPFTGCLDCGRHYRADHVEEARKNSKWWQRLMEVRAKEPGLPLSTGSRVMVKNSPLTWPPSNRQKNLSQEISLVIPDRINSQTLNSSKRSGDQIPFAQAAVENFPSRDPLA